MRRSLLGLIVAAGVMVVSSGVASADKPVEFSESITTEDVDPCTGLTHLVTRTFNYREHSHQGRLVLKISVTGSTDSGYELVSGPQNVVINGPVFKASGTAIWMNPDGRKFTFHAVDVFNKDGLVTSRNVLECVGGKANKP